MYRFVGLLDQPSIECLFTPARFVPGYEQDCVALWIEGERNTPDASAGSESKFLHVRVLRVLQRVHLRPPQRRAVLSERREHREQFILHCRR